MKLIIKTLAAAAVALSLAGAAALSGCTVSLGEDGRDGQDVSIYEIWEATKAETGDPDLTFAEFISQYLSYDSSELGQMTSMQAAINRSLHGLQSLFSLSRRDQPGSFGRLGRHNRYRQGGGRYVRSHQRPRRVQ